MNPRLQCLNILDKNKKILYNEKEKLTMLSVMLFMGTEAVNQRSLS